VFLGVFLDFLPICHIIHLAVVSPIVIQPGPYELSYEARSIGGPRTLSVGVNCSTTWDHTVPLTPTTQTFRRIVNVISGDRCGLFFLVGASTVGMEIDNVSLRPLKTLTLTGTTILRAMAMRDGWKKSTVATLAARSSLFHKMPSQDSGHLWGIPAASLLFVSEEHSFSHQFPNFACGSVPRSHGAALETSTFKCPTSISSGDAPSSGAARCA
jgi:hypothetical protein